MEDKTVTLIPNLIPKLIDYIMADSMSERINNPTVYKGKGRPKNTDYALYKHPFDGKISKSIYRTRKRHR